MIEISIATVGPMTLIELIGRIDSISAPQVDETIKRELGRSRSDIILDMFGVSYMSAAGLRVLKNLYETTGRVFIARPSQRIREVMQITGLDAQYQLYENRVDALHAITPVTNAHTHLETGWAEDLRPNVTGKPFVDWLVGLTERAAQMMQGRWQTAYENAVNTGIQALLDAGTTTVADITATGISIKPLLESGLHGIAYVEVSGTDPSQAEDALNRARQIIDTWRPKERSSMRVGIAIHAPYSTHPALCKKIVDYARQESLPLSIHAAESPAERAHLVDGTGGFVDDYYPKLGLTSIPSPHRSPIGYLEDLGVLELKPLLVHAIAVDDDDIKKIKDSGSTVVHCPRSNLRLRCGRIPLEKYLVAGVPVLLGTDGLGSSPSLNIFDEIEIAVALHHGHVAPEALEQLVHHRLPALDGAK